jgi:hypothetical protein
MEQGKINFLRKNKFRKDKMVIKNKKDNKDRKKDRKKDNKDRKKESKELNNILQEYSLKQNNFDPKKPSPNVFIKKLEIRMKMYYKDLYKSYN